MTLRDPIDPARATALAVALGLGRRFAAGDALPPFFHQVYFWEPQPPEALGRDGHPRLGLGLVPDMGLPRRMWAGGRLAFHAPFVAGVPAEKSVVQEKVEEKEGRTGRLVFVTLRHEVRQAGGPVLTEWQDLVYREDAGAGARPLLKRAPEDEAPQEAAFSTTLLFRYSALTFNGHRIHYDADYTREVEGYPGLVVHGPLIAQLLMLKAEAELGPLARFAFRATAPLFLPEAATLCRYGPTLWARGPDGRLIMEATAEAA